MAIVLLCTLLVSCRGIDEAPEEETPPCVENVEIAYRDYSNYELHVVRNMLFERMHELGIVTLGLGEDWVSIECYEVSPALEEFLVSEIFPTYKSGIVRIGLLSEDVEFRLT